ncbi:UvrD-helicase domain-containing protein [Ruminococcus flavefaciens]|uniref:UvrD-helicase domain-containing protein n=1 Tax=Ruminococcus flavefaciens TaxID=1265 RepID=UPI00350E3C1D
MPQSYTDIFSSRFQYVFIDEYQDCDDIQRQAMKSIGSSILNGFMRCRHYKISINRQ